MVANLAGSVAFFVSTAVVMIGAAVLMWRNGRRPPPGIAASRRGPDGSKEAP